MTEEMVTKGILAFLMSRGWKIVSFDYPQSGTGRALHPRGSLSKTEGVLIPDIVAVKDGVSIYLENKDHYYHDDFLKVASVLNKKDYAEAFGNVLGVNQETMLGGVGLPESGCGSISEEDKQLVDFVLKVNDGGLVDVYYKSLNLPVDFL